LTTNARATHEAHYKRLAKIIQNFLLDPQTDTESEINPNKGLKSQIADVRVLNLFRSAGSSLRVSLKKKSIDKDGKTWKPNEKAIMLIASKFCF
jgi:hypothetical protein